jgi:hypothetical protein
MARPFPLKNPLGIGAQRFELLERVTAQSRNRQIPLGFATLLGYTCSGF